MLHSLIEHHSLVWFNCHFDLSSNLLAGAVCSSHRQDALQSADPPAPNVRDCNASRRPLGKHAEPDGLCLVRCGMIVAKDQNSDVKSIVGDPAHPPMA
jgi:hypothetical protein